MGLGKIINGIKKVMASNQEERKDIPDEETRDKFLRSLRRQRRVQREELEKVRLKEQIADFERDRTRKHLFGLKDKGLPRKKKRPPINRNSTWFSKGGL